MKALIAIFISGLGFGSFIGGRIEKHYLTTNRDVPYKVVGDEQPGIGADFNKPDTVLVWFERTNNQDSICISYLHENAIINIKK